MTKAKMAHTTNTNERTQTNKQIFRKTKNNKGTTKKAKLKLLGKTIKTAKKKKKVFVNNKKKAKQRDKNTQKGKPNKGTKTNKKAENKQP